MLKKILNSTNNINSVFLYSLQQLNEEMVGIFKWDIWLIEWLDPTSKSLSNMSKGKLQAGTDPSINNLWQIFSYYTSIREEILL